MKLLAPKYRAFVYAFSLHAVILSAAFVYSEQCEPEACHEVYSLMHLKSLSIQAPAVQPTQVPVTKPLPAPKATEKPKPVVKKPVRPKPSTVVKKTSTPKKEVTCMCSAAPEPESVREEVKEEKISTDEVLGEQVVETMSQSAVVASIDKPSVSYEAQYMEDNLALINALIKKHLQYPRLAKKRGLQGRTMIAFTLSEEGKVTAIEALGEVASILKRSAVQTIQEASRAFPHPKQTLALQIPIVYTLR